MADNTILSEGSGGDTIRTEDRTTYKTPVSLIDLGGTTAELLAGDANSGVYVDDTSTNTSGTSRGLGIFAVATPTDGSVDANDYGALAMSNDRRLLVDAQIVGTDAALDVSAATVTVTGTVTANLGTANVTNAGTFAVQVDGAGVIDVDA